MPYESGQVLLDKYRIEGLVGRGAFAEVYRATHLTLNAPRALKVLRRDAPGLGSTEYSDFRQRFQLEAQLGAQLDHPNVIRIYDFEQIDGTLLLVMAYAAGGSLTGLLKTLREANEAMPVEEAVRITLDVAEGLAALHALDAVHRDLKPSNILFDTEQSAKIADFGLAQISHGPSMRSQLSQPLPHPGTPAYMSPEQQTIGSYLTPASDVYALGTILFEMLTGRVYRNVRPGMSLRELRSDVPVWLDALLTRMLAKDPEERPWDGAEVTKLLRREEQEVFSTLPTSSASSDLSPPSTEPEIDVDRSAASGKPLLQRWLIIMGLILFLIILGIGLWKVLEGLGQVATVLPLTTESAEVVTTGALERSFTPTPTAQLAEPSSTPTSETTSAVNGEVVSVQVAINADGAVSLNVLKPYLSCRRV